MKTLLLKIALTLLAAFIWAGCDTGNEITGPEKSGVEDSGACFVNSWNPEAGRLPETGLPCIHPGDHGGSSADMSRENGMMGQYVEALITREDGGSLSFRNGRLDIPPMSIDATKVIGARTYSLEQGNFFKKIYEFEPSGTTFDPPATLTLNYCDLGPIMPESIVLRVFNENTNQWEIASTMVNDPQAKTFTGTIEHFSRYSLSGNGQVLRPQTP